MTDSELLGQVRAVIGGDNAWKAVDVSDKTVTAKCVQGPKKGKTDTISRVDFVSAMVQVQ